MEEKKPGMGGERYVPYGERTGNESIVYFTRDLSPEGLIKIAKRVNGNIKWKIAVKLHTGEQHGPNIVPPAWVKKLIEVTMPGASIVETNTYYEGDRYTTELHRETLDINGWNFCPVDITDEEGTALLPVKGGKWFTEMSVGRNLLKYDSLFVLTHLKGHTMGGFGGSNKNIGIGCADGRDGKKWIHTAEGSDNMWSIAEEELMERITESTKATIDHFGKNVCYVDVLRNISVDCDCAGCGAEKVVTPNIGIVASTDILAADQAGIDLLYALSDEDGAAIRERIESRHGHRQLSYMKEMGMGNDRYVLLDIDNGDARILPKDGVTHVVPFVEEPETERRRIEYMKKMAELEAQQ
ncbi:MAG: DUF362 domain-containing protein [Clostridiales bacterium]|nr:DUF362 domain-containing protein [Clostridiales bacterium]